MTLQLLKSIQEYSSQFGRKISKHLNYFFYSQLQILKILRIRTFLIVISIFPLAGSGWIVGARLSLLGNSSTASVEGTRELYMSNFWTS